MVRLVARGDGVVCIHEGADDVVSDPLADLSRVRFHSSLDYPAVVDVRDGSTALPSLTANTTRITTYNLFAHGRPGIPMVLGYIKNFGNGFVPLAGSVPLAMSSGLPTQFVTLGADATNVKLHEYTFTGATQGIAAKTVQWQAAVFDVDLTLEDDPEPLSVNAIKLTATRVELSRGKFDSDNRYIRAALAGVPMPKGRTLTQTGGGNYWYSMDGHILKTAGTPVEPPSTRVVW